ncbi:hypothetical protein [Amycolatopsis pigmentata]|uniref:Pycsar effector protein domain-containing protein n=1 Tax=Amycolatopsis pigmentata TaxID=450801 RepID=A0ABW5G8J0_9PSEU
MADRLESDSANSPESLGNHRCWCYDVVAIAVDIRNDARSNIDRGCQLAATLISGSNLYTTLLLGGAAFAGRIGHARAAAIVLGVAATLILAASAVLVRSVTPQPPHPDRAIGWPALSPSQSDSALIGYVERAARHAVLWYVRQAQLFGQIATRRFHRINIATGLILTSKACVPTAAFLLIFQT